MEKQKYWDMQFEDGYHLFTSGLSIDEFKSAVFLHGKQISATEIDFRLSSIKQDAVKELDAAERKALIESGAHRTLTDVGHALLRIKIAADDITTLLRQDAEFSRDELKQVVSLIDAEVQQCKQILDVGIDPSRQ